MKDKEQQRERDVQILNNPLYLRLQTIRFHLEEVMVDLKGIPTSSLLSTPLLDRLKRDTREAIVSARAAMAQVKESIL